LLRNGWTKTPDRLLFLCADHSILSPMAEAFACRLGGTELETYSAGITPQDIHPLTVHVMAEAGFDLSGHVSQGIDTYLDKLVIQTLITLDGPSEENCPAVWPGAIYRLAWSFPNPAAVPGPEEQRLAAFRAVRDMIEIRVRAWLASRRP